MEGRETNIDRLLKARAELDEALRQYKSSVAVLFTDIVGSTKYFERFGDTAGLALLRRHSDLARIVVEEFGGRVVKTIGDSIMADFAQAEKAVRAAVAIQRRQLALNRELPEPDRIHVRIGVNAGVVYRSTADVFGDVVNLAARITKLAGAEQVLVSRGLYEAIGVNPELPCRWVGKVSLEGKSEREDIYELIWTSPAAYSDLRARATAALIPADSQPTSRLEEFVPSSGRPLSELSGRYELLEEVGRGGMAVVYKAREIDTGDTVALKLLKSEVTADIPLIERFKNEVRLARRITHKNVCRIYEFNRTESAAYIAMEFVEGESLRRVLERFGNLSLRSAIRVLQQICAGLREAHAQGVIHRDLKPENIMLGPGGQVKLMDFGIARSVQAVGLTGALVGTPAYMAPEQAEGKLVDVRADIYALGLILYEMVTGTPTFQGDTPVELALKQVRETPTPPRRLEPTLPSYLEKVILKCLEKDPADRFQSVEDLDVALARAAAPLLRIPGAPVSGQARFIIPLSFLKPQRLVIAGVLLAAFFATATLLQVGSPIPTRTQPASSPAAEPSPPAAQSSAAAPAPSDELPPSLSPAPVESSSGREVDSSTPASEASVSRPAPRQPAPQRPRQGGPPVRAEPRPSPRESSTPPPAASPPEEREAEPEPEETAPAQAQPAPAQPAQSEPAPAPSQPAASQAGTLLVRVGSFSKESDAQKLMSQLEQKGFSARVTSRRAASGLWRRTYDVVVGPYEAFPAAQEAQQKLSGLGFPNGQVVSTQ